MDQPLHPLRFRPVYEQKSWAGNLLAGYVGDRADRETPPPDTGVSWELVDGDGLDCVVANGSFAGAKFSDLVQELPKEIVGRRHPHGLPFPLAVRLLDVGTSQSLLVHPTREVRFGDRVAGPCAKFWLSLRGTPSATITAGIQPSATRQSILGSLGKPGLGGMLQVFPPRDGDSFFIPDCRVHSVGPGNLVWELRQGLARPLRLDLGSSRDTGTSADEHEEAVRSIRFQDRQLGRISRDAGRITQTRRVPLLRYCPRFVVEELRLRDYIYDHTSGESFHLFSTMKGEAEIHTPSGVETMRHGGLVCIPATLGEYKIYAKTSTATLLRVTLQSMT